nr:hypothetical protein [Tanacetum cinerariifolium]
MTFNQYKDAKSLFAAIQTRFGGNEATKKTPKTFSKQMYKNFSAPSTESLNSIFNRLQKIVSQLAILDIMSFDDLYNNSKIIEQEVKGTSNSSSSSNSQNMAFVSSLSSTNEVNTAYGVSIANTQANPASTQVNNASTQVSTANLSDATVFDWRYMDEDEVPTNMALIDFIDSKFQHPEFEGYGPKTSKSVSEDIPNELEEYHDASLVEDRVLDNKDYLVASPVVVEKKTVVPTIAKVKVVRPKQQEEPVRKTVRYAEMYRSQGKIKLMLLRPQMLKRHNYIDVQEDQGYINSGCSRHMTVNMSYLSDFKEFDGGYVTFGGGANGGRITGKGTLKTSKLDFEDVYFVKELKFNLLIDESQVSLKLPRRNNMYSIDMKNIVPKESLTCLVAKATLDKSMLWPWRLGHIKFKNINKLVKDNLVRGLPSKRFENDQTYVACLKGKQQKASCKSKI